jgi:hypothetical protein
MPKKTQQRLKNVLLSIVLIGLAGLLLLPGRCVAQDDVQDQQVSTESYLEVLRADVRANKVAIITEAMQFNDKDASIFWPVYSQYEYELDRVNDQRIAAIKMYADKFATMNDADARVIAAKMLDYESRLATLKKKYFKKFSKVLPAVTVVKFFQLEHRLDLVIDMKIASALPSVLVQPNSGEIGDGVEPVLPSAPINAN